MENAAIDQVHQPL